MTRPTRQQMFMDIAHVVAKRSTCFRLNVGAVAVARNRIVSIGYNGALSGQPHCAGNDCPGVKPGQCGTIHAEINALRYAPPSTHAEDLYITHSPCMACAVELFKYGLDRLFFAVPYRDVGPLDWLVAAERNGGMIKTYQVMPSGFVTDWKTKRVVEL